jgi:hypothetical protein
MINLASGRFRSMLTVLALCFWALPGGSVHAAHVEDLYTASVPVADASPETTRAAFTEALRRVLVKATGRDSAARDPAVMSRFGDPQALVQQFRRDGSGNLWVQFDAAAIRRGLNAAGLPVWGDDRPATVVWLAYDTGSGERDVLAGGGTDGAVSAALRRDLLEGAAARAVPVVLPLRDSQDLAAVTYADLWGDFTEPVVKASGRYQADAVLIGRARLFPAGMPDVRWTLLVGNERMDWRGSIADGPAGLAERLAARLASGSAGAQSLRLGISGIQSLDAYGLVLGYLQGLDVIESLSLVAVAADEMTFDLRLRGDRELLARAFAVGRIVEPRDASGGQAAIAPGGLPPDMSYRLNATAGAPPQ